MKILHTADLHLAEDTPERWDALGCLVKTAEKQEVDALIIAGDLFDQNVAAENMRQRLRSLTGGNKFQVIILSGNHDYKSYRDGLYFGDNVTVIGDPETPFTAGDVKIWGLPYRKISGVKMVTELQLMGSRMDPADKNILLFHGELLDAFFSREDMGDEGKSRYMPVKLSYFETLPLVYVLAGHFHSRSTSWRLPGGGLFIYPGSPVAITRKETGIRTATLISPGEEPREIKLDTVHYEKVEITLDPFSKNNPLDELKAALEKLHPAARVILSVEGFFNGSNLGISESELAVEVKKIASEYGAEAPEIGFLDVQHVLEDDLFRQFNKMLQLADYPSDVKEEIIKMAIRSFREVKACS